MAEPEKCGECGSQLMGPWAPCPFGHVRGGPDAAGGLREQSNTGPSGPATPHSSARIGADTALPSWVTGYPPAGFPGGPPLPRKRPSFGGLIKTAFAVAVVGCISFMAVGFGLAKLQSAGPSHPDEWDPRVEDIASWVQMERGLEFKHPVYVDFLGDEEYSDFVRADEPDGKNAKAEAEQATKEIEDLVGWYRALGLLEGKHDLAEAFDDLYDSGSLAIYSPQTDRITVRGKRMSIAVKVTLAHELTHALQDQQFDLGRMETFTGVKREAFRAVVEGDADRIEQIYVEKELTPEERLTYEAQSDATADLAKVSLAETVPDIILTGFSSAYILGGAFVEVLAQAGGNGAIDEALEDPSDTDEQLFDPFSYLDREVPTKVVAPKPAKGAEVVDEDQLGVTVLYVLLTSRIDVKDALAAIDGWGGDAALISRRDGKICVDVEVVGDDEPSTARLGDALRRWSEATPGDHDRVTVTVDAVTVSTCDPGAGAALKIAPDVGRFLALPQIRSYIGAAVMEQGRTRAEAKCFAGAIAMGMDFDRLNNDESYLESGEYEQLRANAGGACL